MRLFHNASYRFIEARRKAYVVSAIVLGAGIVFMTLNVVNIGSWQNYGVDFTGGSLIQIQVDANLTAGDLRDALGGVDAPPITRFGEESEFVVRAPVAEDGSIGAVADTIEAQLAAAFGEDAFEVVRTEQVGAKVGGELQLKALYAILFSFLLTLIYLAIRFELSLIHI